MLRKSPILLSRLILILGSILVLTVVPGCAAKPYLTPNNVYNIITVSPDGTQDILHVSLPWNTNMAVMQKLLLESSFALSDLHTFPAGKIPAEPESATLLQAIFPQSKHITFTIDQKPIEIDVYSIQIQVEGSHVGWVVINDGAPLQGISNPDLPPAFAAFRQMLNHSK